MMNEWAITVDGEIVNVCMTDGPKPRNVFPEGAEVKLLDDVPLAVKERYRYWNERP